MPRNTEGHHHLAASGDGRAGQAVDEGGGPHHERAYPARPSASTCRRRSGDAFSGTDNGAPESRASPQKTQSGWWTTTGPKAPRNEQGGRTHEPEHRLHARGPLRQGIQRSAGRGPLHLRPTQGAQRLRTEERLHRRPRVRGRGRERPHRRPPGVPQDDRRGRQTQRRVPGDSGLEVLPLHPQAGARRRLQVHAPAQGGSRRLHHRARRRHADGQAHGGHNRERGRVL